MPLLTQSVGKDVIGFLGADSRNASVNSVAFDTTQLDGEMVLILDSEAGTGGTTTLNVKLQNADTATGDYTDVTSAAFTQVTTTASLQKINVNLTSVKKFIRVAATNGAGSTFVYAVNAVVDRKYSDATVPTGVASS